MVQRPKLIGRRKRNLRGSVYPENLGKKKECLDVSRCRTCLAFSSKPQKPPAKTEKAEWKGGGPELKDPKNFPPLRSPRLRGQRPFYICFFCRVSSSLKGLESERGTEIDSAKEGECGFASFWKINSPFLLRSLHRRVKSKLSDYGALHCVIRSVASILLPLLEF